MKKQQHPAAPEPLKYYSKEHTSVRSQHTRQSTADRRHCHPCHTKRPGKKMRSTGHTFTVDCCADRRTIIHSPVNANGHSHLSNCRRRRRRRRSRRCLPPPPHSPSAQASISSASCRRCGAQSTYSAAKKNAQSHKCECMYLKLLYEYKSVYVSWTCSRTPQIQTEKNPAHLRIVLVRFTCNRPLQ